ncbi:MAG: thermonuclease family protein [Sphingomonadaceae bacterium]|nr:thermonuclease family protein [Sphingomonadaceae bacterium]
MSNVPPPPEGFTIDETKPSKRGGGRSRKAKDARIKAKPVDGDTAGVKARLLGVDAFERGQTGVGYDYSVMPLGEQSAGFLASQLGPQTEINFVPGQSTYGRAVATFNNNGKDVGAEMLRAGQGVLVPEYVKNNPQLLSEYEAAQDEAIRNKRGAWAGSFRTPADYRTFQRTGSYPNPLAINVTGDVGDTITNNAPGTVRVGPKEKDTSALQAAFDAGKSFDEIMALGNQAGVPTPNESDLRFAIAERDKGVKGITFSAPPSQLVPASDVQPQWAVTRHLAAFNEGLADTLGAPVDLVNMGLNALGVPVSDKPFLGSESIRSGLRAMNMGQVDASYAPQSDLERYTQAGARGLGQAAIPAAGTIATGARLAASAAPVAVRATGPVAQGFRNAMLDAAKAPGVTLATEAGAGAGSMLANEAVNDYAPDNALLRIGAQTIGAFAGGGLALKAARPRGANVPPPPRGYTIDETETVALNNTGLESDVVQSAPVRQPDVIDVRPTTRPMQAPVTEGQVQAMGQRIAPSDVTPIQANEVGSVDELAQANAGLYAPLAAPDETAALNSRNLQSGSTGNVLPKRGPVDLVTWLRTQGGVQDQGGELSSMGITNASRELDFAKGEARFGPVVNERGLSLDEAAQRAWEAGYFPDFADRPTVSEFLDAVDGTYRGTARTFLPEDYTEIDAFEAARTQRTDVERAATEGRPLFEDRGQPVSLEDVEANTPPVQAYEEWPAGGPDFAGNINLAKLETPQDIKRALVQTENRVGFDAATRGRVTQEETQRLANELGMSADDLLTRRKGQALNAEEALAARQILAKSGNELVNLARRVQRLENPGDEVLAEFQQAWVRHVAIQEQVAGFTAEAGRTLAQFKMLANSRNVSASALTARIQGGGGPKRLVEAAEAIVDAADIEPGKLNELSRDALKPKFRDKLVELWYNSLLSGPQTHVVNMMSNSLTALGQFPEYATAAGIGQVRRVLPKAMQDRVLFSELGARAVGLRSGMMEGMREFARALKTGEPSDQVTKVESASQKAISGVKGEVIRIPSRLLTAEDELFKAIARRMELHGHSVRKARSEGLKGAAAKKRAAELAANPTEDMLERALDYGRYLTFQRPLGPVGSKVAGITQDWPILKLILPFVRTPTNLLKFTVERSPFAPLLKEWRRDFAAGGARRDLAVARAMVGSAAGMAIAELAQQGHITGSAPSDKGKAAMMRANGWQPYSIKYGDKYYSYLRMDPFASTMGVAADLATKMDGMTEKQRDEAALMLSASIMKNLSDKVWLSGLSDVLEAVSDPDRYMDSFINRLGGSLAIPTGVAQVARTVDPVTRERETLLDAVKARIPGLSDNLYPARDIFGQPIENEGGVGPDLISPVWQSTDRKDPVIERLLAAGVTFDKPNKKIGERELTPAEYDAYQAKAGEYARQWLPELVMSPGWESMDNEAREDAVRKTVKEARLQARTDLFGGPAKKGEAKNEKAEPADKSDVHGYLLEAIPGIQVTSGYRSQAYQADMRKRGYNPASNSGHLSGSALDLLPPPGKSMNWLKGQVKRLYPKARLLVEGDHLHATFPGYYKAPVLGNAKSFGLANPNANMPPPPPGFTMEAP